MKFHFRCCIKKVLEPNNYTNTSSSSTASFSANNTIMPDQYTQYHESKKNKASSCCCFCCCCSRFRSLEFNELATIFFGLISTLIQVCSLFLIGVQIKSLIFAVMVDLNLSITVDDYLANRTLISNQFRVYMLKKFALPVILFLFSVLFTIAFVLTTLFRTGNLANDDYKLGSDLVLIESGDDHQNTDTNNSNDDFINSRHLKPSEALEKRLRLHYQHLNNNKQKFYDTDEEDDDDYNYDDSESGDHQDMMNKFQHHNDKQNLISSGSSTTTSVEESSLTVSSPSSSSSIPTTSSSNLLLPPSKQHLMSPLKSSSTRSLTTEPTNSNVKDSNVLFINPPEGGPSPPHHHFYTNVWKHQSFTFNESSRIRLFYLPSLNCLFQLAMCFCLLMAQLSINKFKLNYDLTRINSQIKQHQFAFVTEETFPNSHLFMSDYERNQQKNIVSELFLDFLRAEFIGTGRMEKRNDEYLLNNFKVAPSESNNYRKNQTKEDPNTNIQSFLLKSDQNQQKVELIDEFGNMKTKITSLLYGIGQSVFQLLENWWLHSTSFINLDQLLYFNYFAGLFVFTLKFTRLYSVMNKWYTVLLFFNLFLFSMLQVSSLLAFETLYKMPDNATDRQLSLLYDAAFNQTEPLMAKSSDFIFNINLFKWMPRLFNHSVFMMITYGMSWLLNLVYLCSFNLFGIAFYKQAQQKLKYRYETYLNQQNNGSGTTSSWNQNEINFTNSKRIRFDFNKQQNNQNNKQEPMEMKNLQKGELLRAAKTFIKSKKNQKESTTKKSTGIKVEEPVTRTSKMTIKGLENQYKAIIFGIFVLLLTEFLRVPFVYSCYVKYFLFNQSIFLLALVFQLFYLLYNALFWIVLSFKKHWSVKFTSKFRILIWHQLYAEHSYRQRRIWYLINNKLHNRMMMIMTNSKQQKVNEKPKSMVKVKDDLKNNKVLYAKQQQKSTDNNNKLNSKPKPLFKSIQQHQNKAKRKEKKLQEHQLLKAATAATNRAYLIEEDELNNNNKNRKSKTSDQLFNSYLYFNSELKNKHHNNNRLPRSHQQNNTSELINDELKGMNLIQEDFISVPTYSISSSSLNRSITENLSSNSTNALIKQQQQYQPQTIMTELPSTTNSNNNFYLAQNNHLYNVNYDNNDNNNNSEETEVPTYSVTKKQQKNNKQNNQFISPSKIKSSQFISPSKIKSSQFISPPKSKSSSPLKSNNGKSVQHSYSNTSSTGGAGYSYITEASTVLNSINQNSNHNNNGVVLCPSNIKDLLKYNLENNHNFKPKSKPKTKVQNDHRHNPNLMISSDDPGVCFSNNNTNNTGQDSSVGWTAAHSAISSSATAITTDCSSNSSSSTSSSRSNGQTSSTTAPTTTAATTTAATAKSELFELIKNDNFRNRNFFFKYAHIS